MTGPEHYQAAERWLFKAENQGARGITETSESCAAIAQAHATLSAAAATALVQGVGGLYPLAEYGAWAEVAAVETSPQAETPAPRAAGEEETP